MTGNNGSAVVAESKTGGARNCAVVVLGAGRSGTSLVTRGVGALGVDLGDRLRRPGGKNPTGFFEDLDLLARYQKLKRLLGIRGHNVRLVDPEEWRRPKVEALKEEAVALIRRRFGNSSLWGYKHGRTIRFLPFWEEVYERLDLDVRYVVALRNVLSVAKSRGKMNPRRGRQEKGDLEWMVNVIPYFRQATKRPLVVVDYDRLLADPAGQLQRVADRIHLPTDSRRESSIREFASFIRPDMRHTHFSVEDILGNPRVHPLVRDAYCWLDRLAGDEITVRDEGFQRDWARIEQGVEDLRPVLRHIDQVERDLQSARFHIAGPLQSIPQLWRDWRSI